MRSAYEGNIHREWAQGIFPGSIHSKGTNILSAIVPKFEFVRPFARNNFSSRDWTCFPFIGLRERRL